MSKVKLDRQAHGEYALNDLVCELSLFCDNETIRKVEHSMLESSLQREWDLSGDFKLVQGRNKEVDLVLQELEEVAWRAAGQFNQDEVSHLQEMVMVGRGGDSFDRAFVEQDMGSLINFFNRVNSFDERI